MRQTVPWREVSFRDGRKVALKEGRKGMQKCWRVLKESLHLMEGAYEQSFVARKKVRKELGVCPRYPIAIKGG